MLPVNLSLISFSWFALIFIVSFRVCQNTSMIYNRLLPFGTKTPYLLSFTKKELQLLTTIDNYTPDSCTPVHISTVVRHGTRYPSRKDITAASELAKKLRNKVTNAKYSGLNDWHIPFAPKDAKELAPLGAEELRHVGRRIGSRFRRLLHDAEPEEIVYHATSMSRTINSAEHFQVGLGEALDKDMGQQLLIRDDILRFYDNCTHYIRSVENNKEAMKEYYSFRTGKEVKQVAEKISTKLGLTGESLLTTADAKIAYTLHILQQAILEVSPWQGVFEHEDLEVMEYTSDLKNYWRKGYGHAIAYEQSCILLANIFQHMEESKDAYLDGLEWTKAAFRFAHAETIMPLFSLLGLYRDKVPLTASNFPQMLRRQFKGSRISPFSANVAFVLYHCDPLAEVNNQPPSGVEWPKQLDPFMVQLLVKELPVKFPFCKGHICSYDIVRKHYEQYISGCNYDELCKLHHYQQKKDEL